jgi:hypothetical protein
MRRLPITRASVLAGLITAGGVVIALALGGGAIFSPGGLHAGDRSVETLGGVTSHAALGTSCNACHAPPGAAKPMATRCLDCHTDVARTLADTTTLHGSLDNARSCMSCHTEHRGATGLITRFTAMRTQHVRFGFALDAHARTAAGTPFTCANCHRPESYRFEPKQCASCHQDYQAAFVAKHVATWGANCQSCHDGVDRFSRGQFTHATTKYPLDGAHVKVSCQSCHLNVTRLASFADAPGTCLGCHVKDDKHRGEFGKDCASCHTTLTWKGATFDHKVFPVDHGRNGASSCATCHKDASNYKSYTCYGCHAHTPERVAAQHRDEVRGQDLANCVRCHAGGRGGEGEGDEHEGRRGRREDHASLSNTLRATSVARRMLATRGRG